jgi:ABC-type branched-subunit amino acid transport system substrate-binding protein
MHPVIRCNKHSRRAWRWVVDSSLVLCLSVLDVHLSIVKAASTPTISLSTFYTSTAVSPGMGEMYNVTYRDTHFEASITKDDTLHVGVMYSATGAFSSFGVQTRLMAISWLNDLLPLGRIGSTNKRVVLRMCDVASTDTFAVHCATQMIDAGVSAVVGPESMLTVSIMPLFEAARIPVISPITTLKDAFICDETMQLPCSKRGQRRFQYLYGTQPLASDIMRDYVNIMKNRGIKTIGIVAFPDKFNLEVVSTVRADAHLNAVDVVFDKVIQSPYNAADRDETVRMIRNLNPDAVVYANRANCTETILLFRKHNYAPKSLMTVQCVDFYFRTQIEDPTAKPPIVFNRGSMSYVMGATGWDARVRGPDYQEDASLGYCNHFAPPRNITERTDHSSPAQFSEYFTALTGVRPTYSHSGTMMAFYVIEGAVASSNSSLPDVIRATIRDLYIPTFNGRLVVDVYGLVRGSSIVYYQVGIEGNLDIISPPSAQSATLLYPMPSFGERVFVELHFNTTVEHFAVALVIIGEVYLMTIFVGLICLRSQQEIRAMSWRFSAMTVLGAQILLASPLVWTLNTTDVECKLRVVLLFTGYSTVVGAMFARVFQIHIIFSTTVLRQVSLSDTKLVAVLMGVLAPMYLLFFICMGMFPMYRVEYSPRPDLVEFMVRPSLNYTDCAIDDAANIIFYLLLVSAVMLTCVVDYLARKTRGVRELFNSSMEIRNSLFRFIVCISVVVALVWSGAARGNRMADFTVRSIFIYLACISTVHSMFFAKVWTAFTASYLSWDMDSQPPAGQELMQAASIRDPHLSKLSSEQKQCLPAPGTSHRQPSPPLVASHQRNHVITIKHSNQNCALREV